jgi:hypothetical protein
MPSIAFSRRGFAIQTRCEDAKLSIIAQNQRLGDNFTALSQRSTPGACTGSSASDSAPKGHDRIAFRAASGFKDASAAA